MAGEKSISEGGLDTSSLGQESAAITNAAAKAAVPAPTVSSQIAQQDASQANITNQDLFPGMNQKINVGSSSSQTLGTQPIFVAAGQYVPYNILNKKEEAIAAASKKRAERQAKFNPGKAGELTNKLYQRDLNNQFNTMNSDFIRTAQTVYPDNWDVMLNDPGSELGKAYAQQKSNYDVLAKESNVIFDKTAKVQADRETGGKTIYSDDTYRLAQEINNKTQAFANGKLVDLREETDKFNGSFSLDQHLIDNKVVAQMKADITTLMTPEHGGLSTQEIHDFSQRIEAYAESETATEAGRYYNDNIIKKEHIVDRLTSMMGVDKGKTHKFKPSSGGVAFGKKQDRIERTQKRYETEKAILLDPMSQKAQEALGSLVGVKFGKGVNTAAEYSLPEDYDEHRASGKSLTNFYNDSKDKRDPGFWSAFGSTNPTIESSEFKKEIVDNFNTERTKLGLEGDISSFTVDTKNKNIITVKNNKAQTTRIDMSNPEAVEDYLLGDDAKWKNEPALKISYVEDGRPKTRYLGLDPVKYPDSFSQLNTMQNVGAGEGLDVVQEDLRTLKEAEPGVWGGKKSKLIKNQTRIETDDAVNAKKEAERSATTTAAPATFEDYEKTDDYKSVLAQAKLDFPNATEDQIIKSIKGRYKPKK